MNARAARATADPPVGPGASITVHEIEVENTRAKFSGRPISDFPLP